MDSEINSSQGEFIPFQTLHIVTSNSVSLHPGSAVSKKITHVDIFRNKQGVSTPEGHYLKPESTRVISAPSFGSHTVLSIFPAYHLTAHIAERDQLIAKNNNLNYKLKALQLYKEQHIHNVDETDKEINKLVISPIITLLVKMELQAAAQELAKAMSAGTELLPTLTMLALKQLPTRLVTEIKWAVSILKTETLRTEKIKKEMNPIYLYPHFPNLKQITLIKNARVTDKSKLVNYIDPSILATGARTLPIIHSDMVSNAQLKFSQKTFLSGSKKILQLAPNLNAEKKPLTPRRSTYDSKFNSSKPYTIFLEPLSWMEKIEVAKWACHFIPSFLGWGKTFTLPWNREEPLTSTDAKKLETNLGKLKELEVKFREKKGKRAYLFQVNHDKYADVALLLKTTKTNIYSMWKKGKAIASDLQTHNYNVTRIEKMIDGLTNKPLEKTLRKMLIQITRLQRRSGHKRELTIEKPKDYTNNDRNNDAGSYWNINRIRFSPK